MNSAIVLTIIADDHPGIVESVSEVLARHGGNWSQSSMSSLAGKFAGILLASVPSAQAADCIADLQALADDGLQVMAQATDAPLPSEPHSACSLDLVGHDRPGIVRDITHILSRHGVNVQELETHVESASMAGGPLFHATARLMVPKVVDMSRLRAELEDLANELMVEITLHGA
ncbi:MAG: glycine cleavage system protein R [Xanthomonadales bacterium]|nr:glycine cleavage system protein R [Xanthomonadales bacterium]NIN58781.1 glycine cleavage system protein R [Xanthomonadales bacterium]NIN74049.1 glycine cleavage system protein R [Xanthomonadales bacterium]NIO13799.1 glycine cleavage system protein R [Xanthomonadales bacterium]NIP11174.1 glycine cleavage system protein R [Xanthomonadales bacterium]